MHDARLQESPDTDRRSPTIDRRGIAGVTLASAVGAVCAYVVLVVAARSLDTPGYAEFLVFWGALFFSFGLLTGIQGDITRAVSATGGRATTGSPMVPAAIGVGFGGALAASITGLIWAPAILGASWVPMLGALALGIVLFSGHAAVAGVLGGSGRWNVYAQLVAVEALLRVGLVAVVALWLMNGGPASFAIATVLGSAAWLLMILLRPVPRRTLGARSEKGLQPMLGDWMHAALATASSAALIVGFPVLARIAMDDADFVSAAPVILALMLARGPILLPLGAFQNVLVAHVARHDGPRSATWLRFTQMSVAMVAVISLLAALVGPPLLEWLRPGFVVSATAFAIIGAGSVLIGVLTVTGSVALATGRHRTYSTGWIAALIVTSAVLIVPISVDVRIGVSVILGPLVGIAVHALWRLPTPRRVLRR
jgi:O-antigen/teichoic acid export membrane protein